MDPRDARRTAAMIRIGLGALWPVPGLGAKLFGLDAAAEPSLRVMARLFAIRDLALGLMLLNARDDEGDTHVEFGIMIDAADLVAILLAGAKKQIPARMVFMGGTTAAGVLALGVMGRRVNT